MAGYGKRKEHTRGSRRQGDEQTQRRWKGEGRCDDNGTRTTPTSRDRRKSCGREQKTQSRGARRNDFEPKGTRRDNKGDETRITRVDDTEPEELDDDGVGTTAARRDGNRTSGARRRCEMEPAELDDHARSNGRGSGRRQGALNPQFKPLISLNLRSPKWEAELFSTTMRLSRSTMTLMSTKIRRYHFKDEKFTRLVHSGRFDPDRPYEFVIAMLGGDCLFGTPRSTPSSNAMPPRAPQTGPRPWSSQSLPTKDSISLGLSLRTYPAYD
ncbi:hypothetical protein PIB30_043620 [Stylosanthes scabra]|uniref:Uncharacterized protein n=1 Tax=Stylosanthes scabra TaxID=79078 RepID=A0ABU6VEL2_9FABA|nr:hypothetical protein [Stylosanthes scabra]